MYGNCSLAELLLESELRRNFDFRLSIFEFRRFFLPIFDFRISNFFIKFRFSISIILVFSIFVRFSIFFCKIALSFLLRFYSCGAKNEEIWLLSLSKFSKFSPAALKNEEICLLVFQNFQNFRLRRRKRKKFGLGIFQNSLNFRLRRKKRLRKMEG